MNIHTYQLNPTIQNQILELFTKETTEEEIIQQALEIIFNKTPFDKVKEECEPLIHTFSCRCVTGPHNPFLYRCKTCQESGNSCICVECFKNGNHEGHEYYLQQSGSGGTCDCGTKSWKKEGWCKNHGKKFGGNAFELIPKNYKDSAITSILCLVKKLIETFEKINTEFLKEKNPDLLPNEAIVVTYIVGILNKLLEIDLFFIVMENVLNETKGKYVSIVADKYPEITAMQYLFECAFIESEICKDCMHQFMLTMVTSDGTSDSCFGYFFDMLIAHGKRPLNKWYDKQKSAFACQFYSVEEFTIKHLFNNKQRMLEWFDDIKLMFEKFQKIPKEEITYDIFFNHFRMLSLLHEISSHVKCTFFNIPEIIDEYINILEIATFFNGEKRELNQHVEFDNHAEKGYIFCVDDLLSLGYEAIKHLDNKAVESILKKVYDKYVKVYPKYMLKENIDVGINQAISCYNPLLSYFFICLQRLENPVEIFNQFEEKDILVNYAMIMMQFYMERVYRLWTRNGESAHYKLFRISQRGNLTVECMNYALQLYCSDIDKFLGKLKSISRMEFIKNNGKKEDDKEMVIASGAAILATLTNMFIDPMASCKLTPIEKLIYLFINAFSMEFDPQMVYEMAGLYYFNVIDEHDEKDDALGVVLENRNGKIQLKEEFWKYVNPNSIYQLAEGDLYQTYSAKMKLNKPCIFHEEKRNPIIHQNLLKLLHSEQVTQICVDILNSTEIDAFIPYIETLIVYRYFYPLENVEYTESHKALLKTLGELFAKYKEWKTFPILKKFAKTQLQPFVDGFIVIRGENTEGKSAAKRKKMDILKKMQQKQQAFKDAHDTESEEEEDEEEEVCIICMDGESTPDNPLGSMACFAHCPSIDHSIHQETSADFLGSVNKETQEYTLPKHFGENETEWRRKISTSDSYDTSIMEDYIIKTCPHKIHYNCILEKLHFIPNPPNPNPSLRAFIGDCPICKMTMTYFVGDYTEEENIEESQCILEKPDPKDYVEKVFKIIECEMDDIPDNYLKRFENLFLTVPERWMHLEDDTLMGVFNYLSFSIVSTIRSMEIQMRNQVPVRYEQNIQLLHQMYLYIRKIARPLPERRRKTYLSELLGFEKPSDPISLLVKGFFLGPKIWPTLYTLANKEELMTIFSEIKQHSKFDVPVLSEKVEKKEELPQYNKYETQQELVQALAQTYLRSVEIFKQIILNKPAPLENQYVFPYEETMSFIEEQGAECLGYVIRPTIPQPYKMITLPLNYRDITKSMIGKHCASCNCNAEKIHDCSAICLFCGALLCCNNLADPKTLDKIHSQTSLKQHTEKCCGKIGAYFMIHTGHIYVTTQYCKKVFTNVYLDHLGSPIEPRYLSLKEYTLNEELYKKIQNDFISGEIIVAHENIIVRDDIEF